MEKKTINTQKPSFMQAINISRKWCNEWEDELLSDEVLADRIAELLKTKNGIRGFFAYSLSDINCTLLDKKPFPLIYKLREGGDKIVDILIKNFIMSTAQVINHKREKNTNYENISCNISDRCLDLLTELDTKLVTAKVNDLFCNLDNMGNSFDHSIKYDEDQKSFIRNKINKIAH